MPPQAPPMMFGNVVPPQGTTLMMSLPNVDECFELASISWYEFHLHLKLCGFKKLENFGHKSQGYYAWNIVANTMKNCVHNN